MFIDIPGLPDYADETITRVLLAIFALLLLWLARSLIVRLIITPLRRLAVRGGQTDEALASVFTVPVRYLTPALGIDVAARILELQPALETAVFRVTRTLVIIAVFLAVYKAVGVLALSRGRMFAFTGIAIEERLLPFVRTGAQLVLVAIGLVITIQIWGYDVSGLVAGLGLGGLAISLAAQDTLANLFGFSMIVGDRPFVVGDFIKTPDVEGVVERVGLRSTRIRQLNQALVSVPNSKLANSTVLNWSRLSKRWIDITLRINFDARPEQIQRLLEELRALLAGREPVDESSIIVHFITFGDTALEILVRAYVMLPDWLEFTREKEQVNLEILRIVSKLGLQLAYPTRAIYIQNLSELSGVRAGNGEETMTASPTSGDAST